jgi:hypothetical protein
MDVYHFAHLYTYAEQHSYKHANTYSYGYVNANSDPADGNVPT